MEFTFSLILATYGRDKEIEDFLNSITKSKYDLEKVQIIIVDQNDIIDLDKIIKRYKDRLNILHIKSSKKGLSLNRNIGLNEAKGDFIGFPDDDCRYMPDTINKVADTFRNNEEISLILGRIIDEKNTDSIRNWPKQTMKVNKYNFFTKFSSITMFYKKEIFNALCFNEKLGVGAKYGSCEDADLIYKTLRISEAVYNPEIKLYHPDERSLKTPDSKIYNYGIGFGVFCKQNSEFAIYLLLAKVLAFHTLGLVKGIVTLNKSLIKSKYIALNSRVKGFFVTRRELKNDEEATKYS